MPYAHAPSVVVQELRALRETREGLEDQIERLQWALSQDYRAPAEPCASSSDEDDEQAIRAVRIPSKTELSVILHDSKTQV